MIAYLINSIDSTIFLAEVNSTLINRLTGKNNPVLNVYPHFLLFIWSCGSIIGFGVHMGGGAILMHGNILSENEIDVQFILSRTVEKATFIQNELGISLYRLNSFINAYVI